MRLMLLIIAGNCTRVARQTAVFRSNIFTVDIIDISKGSTASGGGSNNTTTITFHGRIVTPFAIQPGGLVKL
ncbi:hypothetical protein [Citrobacter koseri]|uniref:hypothetical protein n=1 Tax=Citrobacter koseri TaxID=545 RepID=UPI00115A5C7F|nr:hypothetical protein [Citrobacter koseri]